MMKCRLPIKIVTCYWAFLLTFFSTLAMSANSDLSEIQALIKKRGFSPKGIAVYIRDSEQGAAPLVMLNVDKALNPASVIKLLTTAVALDQMGAGYRWKNEVFYQGTLSNKTLKGDLYFRGNGDPYLTPERFWRLLNRIYIEGIQHIDGNVYIDDSYFQPEKIDYGAFDNQPYRSYHVGPNAVLVGFQVTELHFSLQGDKVEIVPFPNAKNIAIDNQVKLRSKGACGRWEKRLQLTPHMERGNLKIKITGQYPASCQHRTMYRRVVETKDNFSLFFSPIWQHIGGSISGDFYHQALPKQAQPLLQDDSISLSDAIRYINKFSNNVMTRQVLLSLAAFKQGPPGTTAKGIAVIEQWLDEKIQQHHISDRRSLVLDNGAGLSRDTRISAKLLGELLLYVYQQAYMPDFVSSLPISGYDLTMADRFENDALIGKVYMKTGLLDFVQSMAGYVYTQSGHRYIVVMLHNDRQAHTNEAARLQNDILRWVFRR